MNSSDYLPKLKNIVSNENKFQKSSDKDIETIKKEANKLISDINKASKKTTFKPLTGSFKPGYLYGAPKIHKNMEDPPLRPIVSTISTPTYGLSKEINDLIKPYIPNSYSISSTKEFIAILAGHGYKIPS